MATLVAEIIINRPVEEVFAAATQFDSHPQWRGGLLKAQVTSPGELGVGSTYTYDMQIMGRPVKTTGEVLAYDPPRTYAWEATSGPFPLSGSVTCTPVESGTRLVETVDATPGGFFKLAEPLLLKQRREQMAADLQNLKQLLENGKNA
jgi:uncharacterized protein YndB with AHSA1/START domain